MNLEDLLPPAADPLGDALHFLRMSGTFYCRSELTAPWGIAIPPLHQCLMFHVVTAGRCWLEIDGTAPHLLRLGDLALVPHGRGHRLVSEPGGQSAALFDLPRALIGDRYEVLRLGGGGEGTTLICGAVRFDDPAAERLLELLPPLIAVDVSASPNAQWIHSTMRLIAAEAQRLQPGGETVITRLADILVIQGIRAWLGSDPAARTGWLGALQDRQVGRAIALVHRDPGRDFTVASLAAEVAMSRSAFAARFTELVGEPVMQYVVRWRMYVALHSLRRQDVRVSELAARFGYESEAAFSRAFKRVTGVSPGAARRSERDARSHPLPDSAAQPEALECSGGVADEHA